MREYVQRRLQGPPLHCTVRSEVKMMTNGHWALVIDHDNEDYGEDGGGCGDEDVDGCGEEHSLLGSEVVPSCLSTKI